MSLLDRCIGLLAPHACLGCGYEGALVCGPCTERLNTIPPRCYRCRKASLCYQTCLPCRPTSQLRSVAAAVVYEATAKELVWQLKFQGAQAAAVEMARRMRPLLPAGEVACVVPVPTATGRVRRRGYDQARLLARELARQSHLPYVDCLRRQGQAHQVGAGRQQRLNQLQAAFWVSGERFKPADRIILVDDVVTTGATLEAAAQALHAAGAHHIQALAFAQP